MTNVSSKGWVWFCPLHSDCSWCFGLVTRKAFCYIIVQFSGNIIISVCFTLVFFFLIQANDPDSGPWGEVKYTIYGSGSDL